MRYAISGTIMQTVAVDLMPGEVVERDVAPGERLLVHAGQVGVMAQTVAFDIQMVRGSGMCCSAGKGCSWRR